MFSGFLVRAQQWRVFASAHSRGLRRDFYASTDNADRFATAHSCGLRLLHTAVQVRRWSLPQRIRAGCDLMLMPLAFADSLCHSAFVRVATPFGVSFQRAQTFATAHSRGLRRNKLINACNFVTLCHSAFVRVATYSNDCTVYMGVLCHSAFVRVATI